MLTGRTITASFVILAAGVAALTQARAHSSSCTPQHLLSTLKQVEAQCGTAKVVSGHRPGARIRGTRRVSQHSYCNGTNGAIDAVFTNRACALSALRKTNYTVLTYGKSSHIHIGTDGWGSKGTRMAQRNTSRVRTASRARASARVSYKQRSRVRTVSKQRASVRVAHRHQSGTSQHGGWNWSE
jgi:hypothetical protein